jgi:hypothetical protein
VDARCLRFEAEWKAGRRASLEEYLGGATGQERFVLLCELVKVELHYRRRRGEDPAPVNFPWLSAEEQGVLRALLERPGPCGPHGVGPWADTPSGPGTRWVVGDVTRYHLVAGDRRTAPLRSVQGASA